MTRYNFVETPLEISINGASRQRVGHGEDVVIKASVVDRDNINATINFTWWCSQKNEQIFVNPQLVHLPTMSGKGQFNFVDMCGVEGKRRLYDLTVTSSSPALATRYIRCVLLVNSPNKLNLLSWLLIYLCNK